MSDARRARETEATTAAQRFYGRWAWLYDLVARRTPGIHGLREDAAAALELSRGDTVVEMGVGTGANIPHLARQVGPDGTVLGIDLTRGVLRTAHEMEGEHPAAHFVRGDATRPPIDGPVDGILASFVVGMLDDPRGIVESWCDLVRPGGRIVLVNAARSERPYGPLVNAPFRGLVLVSTPGRLRFLRTGRTPTAVLDRRIRAAHEGLAAGATVDTYDERAAGIVRLVGATVE